MIEPTGELNAPIQSAVRRTQRAVEQGTMLAKFMILQRFHNETAVNGGHFSHNVARRMSRDTALGFSVHFFERVFACVTRAGVRRGKADTMLLDARIQAVYEANDDLFGARVGGQNLSVILKYEAVQLEANYTSNIKTHFDKYLLRCTRAYVELIMADVIAAKPALATDAARNAAMKACVKAWNKYAFEGRVPDLEITPADEREELIQLLDMLSPPRRPNVSLPDDLNANPRRYLPYMIYINFVLEHYGKKLLSPLPLRTSLVPHHIQIDTATLISLWEPENFGFDKLLVELCLSILLPVRLFDFSRVINKTDMVAKKVRVTFGVRPRKFSAYFKTAVWMAITRMSHVTVPVNPHHRLMRSLAIGQGDIKTTFLFNNSISTNGYKASVSYVRPELYGTSRFDRDPQFGRPAEPPYVGDLTQAARDDLLDNYTLIAGDPGKANLLALGTGRHVARQAGNRPDWMDVDDDDDDDGLGEDFEWAPHTPEARRGPRYRPRKRRGQRQVKHKSGVLMYKATQRAEEAGFKRNEKEAARQLRRHLARTGVDIKAHETSLGAEGRSARSCNINVFTGYLERRQVVLDELAAYYGTITHRRRALRSLLGRKSSIAKHVTRIRRAFTLPREVPVQPPGEPPDDDDVVPVLSPKKIALLYGDWTSRPGFRGGGSTISIGLRRALSREFTLLRVNEFRTSSLCPRCMGPVDHPLIRVTRHPPPDPDPNDPAPDHPAGDAVRVSRNSVHHLLSCPSVNCPSKWWNRDSLGVANIAAKAIRVLLNRPLHQAYDRA